MGYQGRHEFIGVIRFQTPRAILFQDHFWEGPEWMPKSQIKNLSDPETPDEIRISASQWICTAKGNLREFEHRDNPEDAEDGEAPTEEELFAAMMELRNA